MSAKLRSSPILRIVLIVVYLAISVSILLGASRKALMAVNEPFAGVLPFQNLFIGAFTQSDWAGGIAGLSYHDRIVAAEGKAIRNANQWKQVLKNHERVRVQVVHKGEAVELELPVSQLDANDIFRIFGPLFATGLAFLLIGMLAALIQPSPPGLMPFLLYCLLTGIYFLTAFDFHTTYSFTTILLAAYSFVPATVIHVSLTFPRPSSTYREKWPLTIPYFLSLLIFVPYTMLFVQNAEQWKVVEYIFFIYLSLAYLWWLIVIVRRASNDEDADVRRHCKTMLFPLVVGFGAIFVCTSLVFVFDLAVPLNWVAPCSALFPIAVAIGMFRSNLFMVDKLEQEVQLRTAELRDAHASLTEATKLAAVGQLSAGVAHEIGNAMNLVLSNLSVLKQYSDRLVRLVESSPSNSDIEKMKTEFDYEFLRSDLAELLENVHKGAAHAMDISADLKTFSRPSASASTFALVEAMESTLKLLGNEFGDRIEIRKTYEGDPNIRGSEGQIRQVFLNLLLNAVQSIEQKGTIDISIAIEGGYAITTITDTGKGVAPEQLSRLTEPFYSTRSGGTGLGLSVSHGIIEGHNGELQIESEPNRGTHVTVKLPVS